MSSTKPNKSRIAIMAVLFFSFVTSMAILFVTQPANAAEECWSSFSGLRCHHSCPYGSVGPPPPGEVCAVSYSNGQPALYCTSVEIGECSWSCSEF